LRPRPTNTTGGGHCLHEFAAHKLGLNALAAVPSGVGGGSKGSSSSSKGSSERCLLLSAGKDHALRLWQVCATGQQQQQQQQQDASGAASAQCLVQYSGHKEAVQAVAASPSGTLCCSGGWDGQLLVWQTGAAVAEEAAAAAARGAAADTDSKAAGAAKHKRRRGASAAAAASHDAAGAPAAAPLQLQPASALLGHMHCVAGVAWPSAGVLYSGGWDHSVRRFDVESGRNTVTHNGSKAVYAVAAAADAAAAGGAGSADVVAFAGGDRVLRFWDSRSGAGEALAITAHSAHDGWVSALAWRPGSAYQLASGGCDGVVKLWDVRSGVPLASLQHHQQGEARAYGGAAAKVLAVSWAGHSTLLSGGSDCAMRVYAA
jgi:ribosome biogenesis protein YTM1